MFRDFHSSPLKENFGLENAHFFDWKGAFVPFQTIKLVVKTFWGLHEHVMKTPPCLPCLMKPLSSWWNFKGFGILLPRSSVMFDPIWRHLQVDCCTTKQFFLCLFGSGFFQQIRWNDYSNRPLHVKKIYRIYDLVEVQLTPRNHPKDTIKVGK